MKTRRYFTKLSNALLALIIFLASHCNIAFAATSLADTPILAVGASIPGNVALVLSVEFPTGDTTPYPASGYSQSTEYLGYFDPNKCYKYFSSPTNGSYFTPVDLASSNHNCSAITNGRWSGNFLNWSLTQVIDPMRSTLTGGYRYIDIDGLTVLEKAYADAQGAYNAPNHTLSNSTAITQSTPYPNTISALTVRVGGLDTRLLISSSGDVNASNTGITTFPTNPDADKVYDLMARVEVCKTGLLETNCTLYPNGNYKPTGLIQKNALKLNFAAFGYLFDSDDDTTNLKIDGGVLRARMAALGPIKTVGSSSVNNANAEWDSNSGVFKPNPDKTDADNSNVSNSGVINYLNKFGMSNKSYKRFDPVSELYYAATRYFRKKGNVIEYTDLATKSNSAAAKQLRDGFPVIDDWTNDDPIKYACQQNFILGIGDSNTHADANLPGSTLSTGSKEPSLPSEVEKDNATKYGNVNSSTNTDNLTDVKTSTSRIGTMEGLGNLGEKYLPWCCNNSTFFMAGIAYDVHTTDIRPDFTGNQTITTYWLDVLESGDRKDFNGQTGMRNQYWLATKYGGFTVPAGYSPYGTLTTLTKSQWDTDVNKNADGTDNDDPDNYYRANNPAAMAAGLDKAFSAIANSVNGSSSAFTSSSPSINSGALSFGSTYSSAGWTGDVVAKQINIDSNGIITTSNPIWSAATKLESQNYDTGRFIATIKSGCNLKTNLSATTISTGCGVPFRFTNGITPGITTAQKTALDSTGNATNQGNILNFLRGDRSNAGTQGLKIYRDRVTILGDIVNSKVVPVGIPNRPYIESFNSGYSSFITANSSRPTVVYVGANDGMLHAFDGASGKELFAYVPNALFQGPNNTPNTDGLAQLAVTAYVHHYYVDATPQVSDVSFTDGSWHTLLVGGLGKGGKAYFALDVTNPSALSNETNLSSAVMWEFTHPDLGFTYDTPLIIKTAKYGWVVVLTSGYNNTDGKGHIFIVDPQTGVLLKEINTCDAPNANVNSICGSASNEAGLAHVNAFVADARTGLADALYAGDLLGNVWRVPLTGPDEYLPKKIASLFYPSSGQPQPVTTSPIIQVDASTGKRYVFIGTGKLLDSADASNTQTQTFYAINDGTLSSFYSDGSNGTPNTLPSAAGGFPITRDDMVADTDVLNGVTANSSKPMGYYIDLGTYNGKTNFISTELASASGIIAFAANSIDNTDVCNPTGSNITYALSYGTGQSVLQDAGGNLVSYLAGSGLSNSLAFVQSNMYDPSSLKLVNSSDDPKLGGKVNIYTPKLSSTKPFTQLNWRELPTAD